MTLLADSGSTKTRWVFLSDGRLRELVTQGLNPLLTPSPSFLATLSQVSSQLLMGAPVSQLFFYGAGCGSPAQQSRVARLLQQALPVAPDGVHVEGDILGACRAVCGARAGLVGIFGTGSNLCYFDGSAIALQHPSLGFILGDEGSGNHIGRLLLKDYLEHRMPPSISAMFHDAYPQSPPPFLNCLYRQPNPNRFLASLAPFAAAHQSDPYVAALLDHCFGLFLSHLSHLGPHPPSPLHLVGGLTRSFAPSLSAAASSRGVDLGTLLPDPVPGLLSFHAMAL